MTQQSIDNFTCPSPIIDPDKVAMLQCVRIGDGGHRVVQWRQSFQHPTTFEETDIACPGPGASRFMVVAEIRRQRSFEMASVQM